MKKNNFSFIKIPLIIIAIIAIMIFIVYVIYYNSNNEILEEFQKEGYNSSNQDIFYKKVITNNTLDDFYKDMANKKDTQYKEYYFKKDSTDFIEFEMIYQNGVSTSLNIVSNLKTNETEYNYELAYKDAHLLLQGNSKDDYDCQVIKNNKVSEETSTKYCNMIMDEITEFNKEKEQLLQNEKIKELIK